nr:hypothetical protein CFP56_37213 [Quercus suber]
MSTLDSVVCYNERGNQTGDSPCDSSSSNQCCGSGYECLDNGLCQKNGTTAFAQGSCTDIGFASCLDFCAMSEIDGTTKVSSCGGNSWCCGGPDCCDDNTTTTLHPYPYSTITAGQIGQASNVVSTKTSSRSTTEVSSRVLTSTVASLQSLAPATSLSAPNVLMESPIGDGLSTGVKAGIGVAIPLAMLLLGALAFFIWKSRRQEGYLKTLQQSSSHETEPGNDSALTGEINHTALIYELEDERRNRVPEIGDDALHELASMHVRGRSHELSGQPRYEI